MTRPSGSYYVIGYGGKLEVPTLDIISTERNIVGNIVGTYNELAELMVLAQTGRSPCTPAPTRSTQPSTRSPTSTPARSAAAPSSSPEPLPLDNGRLIHGQGTACSARTRAIDCSPGWTSSRRR